MRVWYLTMMVTGVGTNGIFVVLLRSALVTVLWSVAPNSVVFDVLPSAFKQYSSLLWFTGFVSAATLDAMLYAATGGSASRRFCPLLGFATAWFAFDFVGAATIIFCCFQPPFVTEMIFDRSLQNLVSGHEIVVLFLVSVVGMGWFLVPGCATLRILAMFVHCSLVSGGLVKDKDSGKGICFSKKMFVETVASQALTVACLAAAILELTQVLGRQAAASGAYVGILLSKVVYCAAAALSKSISLVFLYCDSCSGFGIQGAAASVYIFMCVAAALIAEAAWPSVGRRFVSVLHGHVLGLRIEQAKVAASFDFLFLLEALDGFHVFVRCFLLVRGRGGGASARSSCICVHGGAARCLPGGLCERLTGRGDSTGGRSRDLQNSRIWGGARRNRKSEEKFPGLPAHSPGSSPGLVLLC